MRLFRLQIAQINASVRIACTLHRLHLLCTLATDKYELMMMHMAVSSKCQRISVSVSASVGAGRAGMSINTTLEHANK